jgi:tetratricopeptide (TPR) repeat protein
MQRNLWSLLVLTLCAGLCAGEGLVNTFQLDSGSESYRLALKEDFNFELTGPGGEQVVGKFVASDRKIGLVAGNLLRHFEYQILDGNLLLRPSNTDGPETTNALGKMPPVQRGEQFTPYLTEAKYRQKYAARQPVQPITQPAVAAQPTTVQPVATQPVVAAMTMEQLLAQAQNDSQYHAYMAAGTKALSEKRYPEARAHFIVASRLKPNDPEAKDQMALCDGATALTEGDAARQRGEFREAREAYVRAKQICPPLTGVADQQLEAFGRRHGGADTPGGRRPLGVLETGVAQNLKEGRTADALRLSTNALQLDPTSERLRTMKEGIEGLQNAEGLYQNLSNILARASTQCDAIQKVEPLDGQTAQWTAAMATKTQQVNERLAATRNRYVENPYAGLGTTLADARSTADETATLLEKSRAFYAAKAAAVAKEDQIDLPFMTIKTNKENKRVTRLNTYADGFKVLSAEAAALAK